MFKLFHIKIDVNSSDKKIKVIEVAEKEINEWGEANPHFQITDFQISSLINDRNDFAELFIMFKYKNQE